MKKTTCAATAVLLSLPVALAACGSSHASAPGASRPVLAAAASSPGMATITTQGVGTVVGAPDTARVAIGVSTTAAHAAAALAQNNTIAAAVQAALAKDGVASKDIQTSGLSVQQNWGPQGPTGYAVEDDVTATLRDLSRAGTIIDDALAPAGDSGRLEYVDLSVSDSNPLMAAARQQAVSSAKVQAQQMASAAGLQLGSLVSLSDQPAPNAPSVFNGAQMGVASAAPAMPPVPIQAGSQQLTVTVTAVWQTAPGA